MHIDAAKLAFYKPDTMAMVQPMANDNRPSHFWADAVILFSCKTKDSVVKLKIAAKLNCSGVIAKHELL